MAHEERGIDAMKYRKSTHLAGIDVETIIAEKGSCIVTIKDAYYAKNVDVSGNKTDGYFLEFTEPIKAMVVNSVNRKTVASNVKLLKKCTSTESRNIGNWIGVKIELYYDETVKMMGKQTGGIRIKPQNPIIKINTDNATAVLSSSKTLDELSTNWSSLNRDEQSDASITALKEKLKGTLK